MNAHKIKIYAAPEEVEFTDGMEAGEIYLAWSAHCMTSGCGWETEAGVPEDEVYVEAQMHYDETVVGGALADGIARAGSVGR